MTAQLRGISEADYDSFVENMGLVFGFDRNPDEDSFRQVVEYDRAFGHFDGNRLVSTISAFSLAFTVPGSVVDCAGTTVVSVSPSHRRQGLLREMMQRHLEDAREREDSIAALWASESEIYGRFGYGRASQTTDITIRKGTWELSRHAPDPAPVRLIRLEEAKEIIPAFHDQFRVNQPGMFSRSDAWWNSRVFADYPSRRDGFSSARWGVTESDGRVSGFVRYRAKGGHTPDGHLEGELVVQDLFGSTPESWAGLWVFVLSNDLMGSVKARLRSVDDPIFDLLAGPRRAQSNVSDGVWVRLMDVAKALSERSYLTKVSTIFEVHDPMGMSGGRYLLEASPEGATCATSNKEADITLDIADLGSIYLGRAGLGRMKRVGRVDGADVALRQADLAFGWEPQPWCPEIF